MIASNGGQVVEGPDQTFTTLPSSATTGEPSIEGVSAAHVTDTDGTLEAQINPDGLDTSYEFYLEYPSCFSGGPGFCEASGGKEIASGTIPAGSSTQTVSEDVAAVIGHSLLPDTTYGYRVVASNAAATKYSGLQCIHNPPGQSARDRIRVGLASDPDRRDARSDDRHRRLADELRIPDVELAVQQKRRGVRIDQGDPAAERREALRLLPATERQP